MLDTPCITCAAEEYIRIPTYKRDWYLCRECGTAVPRNRTRYPLSFLPYKDLKKNAVSDPRQMYDYFVEPVHIEHSRNDGRDFIARYIQPNGLNLSGKTVLDLSGGNGHFLCEIQRLGATVSLTEFNRKTVEYVDATHDFAAVFEYDMNNDNLAALTQSRYDLILARANLMFCDDLQAFIRQAKTCLAPGGIVIVNYAVEPTLGVLVRVQLDEFSYHALRQNDVVQAMFERAGFETALRQNETDPTLYVYDHDLLPHWMALHYFYEIRGARILKNERLFALPARDRRRSTFIFRLAG